MSVSPVNVATSGQTLDGIKNASYEQRDDFDVWAGELRGYTEFVSAPRTDFVYPPFRALNGIPQPPSVHRQHAYWDKLKRDFFWIRINGSSIPHVWPTVLAAMCWTALWCVLDLALVHDIDISPPGGVVISGLIAFATSLLLGFRVNSAYER